MRRAQMQKLQSITRLRGAPIGARSALVALGPVGPTGDPTPKSVRRSPLQMCRARLNGPNALKSPLKVSQTLLRSHHQVLEVFLCASLGFFKTAE